ncbi:hypothetical protein [Maribellus maritimus]|uniref:hypothetical protein n=1 Tax=Maribellus maritimus TaxID=2870838 RepID=UPI001EE9F503|nr:hypothetical protein [Maribellus maritimus]MCG6190616.1 hypothetical protein [Maribellus maritimus]
MKNILQAAVLIVLFTCCQEKQKEYPSGIIFKEETVARKGLFGDNWCQTWAADGNIYTMLDDGNGWWGDSTKNTTAPSYQGSMCIRIEGDENFADKDVTKMEGWPVNPGSSSLYAYGTISVEGVIYVWLWKSATDTWYRRPIANRLLYSPDLGQTFYRWNDQRETEETFGETDSASFFFYKEDPRFHIDKDSYAFNWIAFCQNGKDNSAAKDDFVYMYAPEQHAPDKLSMIRVHKDKIRDKESYEYFKHWEGEKAEWTKNMKERGVNLQYPQAPEGREWMWASWLPSVVYNEGLDLYMMVSYGITDENKSFWDGWCNHCKYPACIGFWYSKTPYGPWKQFYYEEDFYVDREENRTYGFKLNPKWISEDGKKMVLIWSDAGDDHTTNYKWNQMEIEITTEEL